MFILNLRFFFYFLYSGSFFEGIFLGYEINVVIRVEIDGILFSL